MACPTRPTCSENYLPNKETMQQSMSIDRMATELEDIVRKNGAVPATIGIIDGRVHIGELCVV